MKDTVNNNYMIKPLNEKVCRVAVEHGAQIITLANGQVIPGVTDTIVSQTVEESKQGLGMATITLIVVLNETKPNTPGGRANLSTPPEH